MWPVIGHDQAVAFLEASLAAGRLAHAYLVKGPEHVGKMTLARSLAQALNCLGPQPPCQRCDACRRIAAGTHPDVQIIAPGSGGSRLEVGIDQVRELQRMAALKPYLGRYRVFIVDGAEHMTHEAANCLLKTLEEPPPQVVIALLATLEETLPPTILSRCQRLELRPMAAARVAEALKERLPISPEMAQELARFSQGCLGWALEAAADEGKVRERAAELSRLVELTGGDRKQRLDHAGLLARDRGQALVALKLWLTWWRDLLLMRGGHPAAIINADREAALRELASRYSLAQIAAFIGSLVDAGRHLEQNANARLALEVLMLSLPSA